MLDKMRKRSSSFIIWFFFSIIIIAFIISFGPGSFRRAHFGAASVGSVNGEEIPRRKFNVIFEDEYERRRRYDKEMTEEKIAQLQQEVFERLAVQTLWEQEAEERGLEVSDKVLAEIVRNNPIFQEDGKFSQERYERYIAYIQSTIPEYEKDLRRRVGADMLRNTLSDSAFATSAEAWEFYLIDNDRVNLEYIKLAADKAEKMGFAYQPTDDEIANFVKENQKRISDYYEEHKSEYEKPARIVVDVVVVKAKEGEVIKEARKRAEKLAEDAKNKKSLKEAASSAGLTVEEDKEIPKVGEDKDTEERLASAKDGEIVGPIAKNDEFFVYQVKKHLPEEKRSLDDSLKKQIAKELLIADAKVDFLKEKANQYIEQLKGGLSVNDVVPYETSDGSAVKQDPESGISSGQTRMFARNASGYIRGIGISKELMQKAFELTPDNPVAGPFEIAGDVYVVRLKEREEPKKEEFANKIEALLRSYNWRHRLSHIDGFEKWMKSNATIESEF